MAEVTGVSAPVYTIATSPPPAQPVEQTAPESTDLASELGIGSNIDVSG